MNKNYYKILNVSKSADKIEIIDAFGIRGHVLYGKIKNPFYVEKFFECAEAYDVLINDKKRKIYDKYGEVAMKNGVILDNGEFYKYKYEEHPQETFAKCYFASKNAEFHTIIKNRPKNVIYPSSIIFGNDPDYVIKTLRYFQNGRKSPTIVWEIRCTLLDLYVGCAQRILPIFGIGQHKDYYEVFEKYATFKIEPGWPSKVNIVFEGIGHTIIGKLQGDVMFTLRQTPNPLFVRYGDNLIHHKEISKSEAESCSEVLVPNLLGGTCLVPISGGPVLDKSVKLVDGGGMPVPNQPGRYGDLLVIFHVNGDEE